MKIPGILIVDDETDERATIGSFLKGRIKCRIHEAGDGEEALKKLREHLCDIMVLDVRMPKKSGIHVLDEMESLDKSIETIVITAWDSDLVAEECAKRGVECIPKPLILSQLYGKIEKCLKEKNKFIPAELA